MRSPAMRLLPSNLKDWPQKAGFLMVAGSVSLALVSIAASQILLGGAIVAAILQIRREGRARCMPVAILWPLLFLFVWTLIAAYAASGQLHSSLVGKFFLFTLLFILPVLARGSEGVIWIYHAVFAVAAVASAAGLVQYFTDPERDLLHRIQGFMSIWMTYSGLLMLVLVSLIAYAAVIGWRKHLWILPLAGATAAALYFSQTRSAWLGAVAGTVVILLLKRPRAILGLPVLLLALYMASPEGIQERLRSGWNPADTTTSGRIEVFGAAVRLIQAHPWLGVGQRVSREVLRYRGTAEFPDYAYLHMHNNFLQIAAERGIPGLLLWLWFMFQLGWQPFLIFRSGSRAAAAREAAGETAQFVSATAVGAWAALLTSGMFEYNFGDSEVLTLFLFMMGAPHAAKALDKPGKEAQFRVAAAAREEQ